MARGKLDKSVTLIAPHTEVIGDIRFSHQLYVSGRVTGNIIAENDEATLVVSDDGCVTGEVRVANVVINGAVDGDVRAVRKVELAPKAKVKGNVFYKLIEMQLGALVEGQLVHEDLPSQEASHSLQESAVQGSSSDVAAQSGRA